MPGIGDILEPGERVVLRVPVLPLWQPALMTFTGLILALPAASRLAADSGDFGFDIAHAAAGGFMLVAIPFSIVPVFFLAALAAKTLFGLEWLRRHLSVVLDRDRWSGRTTALRSSGRLARLLPCYFKTCARWLSVAPLLEPQPDLRAGATPEMAVRSLKLAEGAE